MKIRKKHIAVFRYRVIHEFVSGAELSGRALKGEVQTEVGDMYLGDNRYVSSSAFTHFQLVG